jgi:probable rRNA maturation factor
MPTTGKRAKPRPPSAIAVQRAARAAPPAAFLRRCALAAASGRRDVTLRVVGAAEGRALNRAFRRRDYATNVLSFPYDARRGDIVLCHPVIAREARQQGKRLRDHYAHLVVHGMLHLRGHDHQRAAEAACMERAEVRILRRLGVGDPYAPVE